MNQKNRSTTRLVGMFAASGLLASIALAGCKDDVVTPTPVAVQNISITIKANKLEFSNENLKVGRALFTITNADTITHDFEIEEEKIAKEWFAKPLTPNQTMKSDTLTLTAGTWEFYDPKHKQDGVDHDIVVVP